MIYDNDNDYSRINDLFIVYKTKMYISLLKLHKLFNRLDNIKELMVISIVFLTLAELELRTTTNSFYSPFLLTRSKCRVSCLAD